jgi:hypothetical protein
MKYTSVWKGGLGKREKRKYNGGGKHVQSTLYACIESSQLNPIILLMYANSNIKQFKKKNEDKEKAASTGHN